MKAVAYQLEAVASVAAATQRLGEGGWGSKPVAGGQSLGAMLNLRLAQPETLIDLDQIEALRAVHAGQDAVTFGAMLTHAAFEDGKVPDPSRGLMPFVARRIAYRAVRNRGTLGGSLCHADPAADWVSTMPLLGATLRIDGAAGSRVVPAADFMVGAFETQLADGELLAAISVPVLSANARWSYRKFCRKTGEFAQALACALHDPGLGIERIVLGALDGAPQVFEGAGLLASLGSGPARAAWLAGTGIALDGVRMTLLAEMLRLVVEDMETPR
nr:FAD binding domain-containing protein [uncultured Cupriavidus sp.]